MKKRIVWPSLNTILLNPCEITWTPKKKSSREILRNLDEGIPYGVSVNDVQTGRINNNENVFVAMRSTRQCQKCQVKILFYLKKIGINFRISAISFCVSIHVLEFVVLIAWC